VDLQVVQHKAQALSADVTQSLREHLNRGQGEVHQQVIDAGNRLKKLSDDLLRVMEHSLGEVHDARREELQQVLATVAAESSRLQEQIAVLDRRMGKLDESARHLESGLDKRLSQMSSDTVRTARSQLESALEEALAELSTRNLQELGSQLGEARLNLQAFQKEIEASTSQSLKIQASDTLQSFERRTEEMAQQSVERWRLALAGSLNSLARTLGEQFALRTAIDDHSPESSG